MVRHNNAQGNQLGLQVGSEQTDPNGRFRIAGVGSGSYTLHVVHDDFKQLQQEIVLGADESSPEIEDHAGEGSRAARACAPLGRISRPTAP